MIYLIIRYSVLIENSKSWILSQDKENYEKRLFDKVRLDKRFNMFKNIVLPSLIYQTKKLDTSWFKLVLISSELLPKIHKEKIENLLSNYDWAEVHYLPTRGVSIVQPVLDDMKKKGEGIYCTVRLDDDDALAINFFEELNNYVSKSNVGYALSFGQGYCGFYDFIHNKYEKVVEYYYPKFSAGLAFIDEFNNNKEFKTVFNIGSHSKVDKNVPTLLVSNEHMFIRTMYDESDSYTEKVYSATSKGKSICIDEIYKKFPLKVIKNNVAENNNCYELIDNKSLEEYLTGRTIKGIPEYILNGVRFLYKKGESNRFYTFYSSFSKKGNSQSYNYIKKSIGNSKDNFLYFLDTETPIEDPRGTYFIKDETLSYAYQIKYIIEHLISNVNDLELFYFGSSKGGTGALIVASLVDKGTVCINAPQVLIGDYLYDSYSEDFFEKYLSRDFLNNIVSKRLSKITNVKIYISCGVYDDEILYGHLEKLFISGFSRFKLIPVRGGHNGLALEDYGNLINLFMSDCNDYNIEHRIKDFSKKVVNYYLTIPASTIFESIDIINKSFDIDESYLEAEIKSNLCLIYLDENALLVTIRGFYGFEICVYAKNINDRTLAKPDSYKSLNHIFKLHSTFMSSLDSLKVFVKFNNSNVSFNIDLNDIDIFTVN